MSTVLITFAVCKSSNFLELFLEQTRNYLMQINFCANCGNSMQFNVVEGDHLPRYHCTRCGFIAYQNPHIIVGCLPIWKNKIMLCKRGIEPRMGFWNLPGGFMENNETIKQGATREMKEETGADVKIIGVHSIFSVPQVNQLHIHFLAELINLDYVLTPESIEIEIFDEGSMPWADIAFASTDYSIKTYFSDLKKNTQSIHTSSTFEHEFFPIY